MGSASRGALASSKKALAALGAGADLATAEDLFRAARLIGDSGQLRSVLADPTADAEAKSTLVSRIFSGQLSQNAVSLLATIAGEHWSTQDDLLEGVEEIGIRAIAASAPEGVSIEEELFAFGGAVSSNDQLELALASKLGRPEAKESLLEALLAGKAAQGTLAIVRQLVLQPRGRRLRVALEDSAAVVADEAGQAIATVTAAVPLADDQLRRLAEVLSAQYGRRITVNVVVEPAVIGGLRVQIGDDVIDGTIATRLNDVRLKLAG
jgi:F-type H+-transporting ATPase subunit delta